MSALLSIVGCKSAPVPSANQVQSTSKEQANSSSDKKPGLSLLEVKNQFGDGSFDPNESFDPNNYCIAEQRNIMAIVWFNKSDQTFYMSLAKDGKWVFTDRQYLKIPTSFPTVQGGQIDGFPSYVNGYLIFHVIEDVHVPKDLSYSDRESEKILSISLADILNNIKPVTIYENTNDRDKMESVEALPMVNGTDRKFALYFASKSGDEFTIQDPFEKGKNKQTFKDKHQKTGAGNVVYFDGKNKDLYFYSVKGSSKLFKGFVPFRYLKLDTTTGEPLYDANGQDKTTSDYGLLLDYFQGKLLMLRMSNLNEEKLRVDTQLYDEKLDLISQTKGIDVPITPDKYAGADLVDNEIHLWQFNTFKDDPALKLARISK